MKSTIILLPVNVLILTLITFYPLQGYGQSKEYKMYIENGKQLGERHKYDLANEQFRKAISLDPNNPYAYFETGYFYAECYSSTYTLGDSSIFYYEKVLALDSNYKNIHLQLGHIKGLMHDFTGAIKELDIAVKTNPDTTAYLKRALVRFKLNDNEGVCSDMAKAVELGSWKAKYILLNKLLDVKCNSVVYTSPYDIVKKAYSEISEKKSVSYEMLGSRYEGNKMTSKLDVRVCMKRPGTDTVEGFYLWVAQSDVTYFFWDMHHAYVANKKMLAATSYDTYFFETHFIINDSKEDMVWSSFATPDKLKEKLDSPIMLLSMPDTVFNGIDCYRVLVKYPDNPEMYDRRLIMYFNKADYMPFYVSSTLQHDHVYYTGYIYYKDYSFENVPYSKFSVDQIPKEYHINVYDPTKDK